uniref:AlNc14C86G5532 protein n=1 Tax=Albugo laibachii Nc14 TaxID=890382 RepID=F0WFZ9_9STRA|nr:AlNc14C86G5532 [Albugo laibachii Nc14]|eukprot:CCA20133.1 AlNc14C86G5532 [Albugo laibachii Nc14]
MSYARHQHFTIRSGMTVQDLKQLTARRELQVIYHKMIECWGNQMHVLRHWERLLFGCKSDITEYEEFMCMENFLTTAIGRDTVISSSQHTLSFKYPVLSDTDVDMIFTTAGGQLVSLLSGVANAPVIPRTEIHSKIEEKE